MKAKSPKLSFQPRQRIETPQVREEIEQPEPTPLEEAIDNYIKSFVYFGNCCTSSGVSSEAITVLWELFVSK